MNFPLVFLSLGFSSKRRHYIFLLQFSDCILHNNQIGQLSPAPHVGQRRGHSAEAPPGGGGAPRRQGGRWQTPHQSQEPQVTFPVNAPVHDLSAFVLIKISFLTY